jgi:putative nucleotidyltransferase with HDIG domain
VNILNRERDEAMNGSTQHNSDRRDIILSKIKEVPALPALTVELCEMIGDKDVDVKEIIRRIEFDPSLTANVLGLANSSYFGVMREIPSVHEAVVRLGLNRIFHLVMASVIGPIEGQEIKGYDLLPGGLWEHSIAVAICTDNLAKALKINPPDHVFTAALLIDIGKIVMGTFVEIDVAPITKLAFEQNLSFELAERKVLGIDHAEVGAALLEYWNLPDYLVQVVKYHHEPEKYKEDKVTMDLIHTADLLCQLGGIGAGVDGSNYTISEEVTTRLNMSTQIAENVIYMTVCGLKELSDLLSLNPGR